MLIDHTFCRLVIGEDKHSLEDDSLGVSATDLSSIDDVQIQGLYLWETVNFALSILAVSSNH